MFGVCHTQTRAAPCSNDWCWRWVTSNGRLRHVKGQRKHTLRRNKHAHAHTRLGRTCKLSAASRRSHWISRGQRQPGVRASRLHTPTHEGDLAAPRPLPQCYLYLCRTEQQEVGAADWVADSIGCSPADKRVEHIGGRGGRGPQAAEVDGSSTSNMRGRHARAAEAGRGGGAPLDEVCRGDGASWGKDVQACVRAAVRAGNSMGCVSAWPGGCEARPTNTCPVRAGPHSHEPKLEKLARASVLVVAPTVMAAGALAGDTLHAFWASFPAATA